ncbi:hypothetical protein ACEPAH_5980 [Sanghuangporus vaninii]
MASDDEDDYLSEKFLLGSTAESSNKPLTYAERRKQAQRQSEKKNVQNRAKSRREREAEAREQGLRQSLFERAQAEKQETGAENKAVKMMLRMGFKPGESLGRTDGIEQTTPGSSATLVPAQQVTGSSTNVISDIAPEGQSKQGLGLKHRTAPLAVDMWSGKKGVGLGKRAPSPGALERASKAARIDEDRKRETYRSHTREAFEERRVLGRLSAASRTLLDLDEKAGIQFNILSLNPQEPETIPSELLEALSTAFADDPPTTVVNMGAHDSERERLRKQMEMDALQPLQTLSPEGDSDSDKTAEIPKENTPNPWPLSDETIDEAREFLRLNAQDRLKRVLQYLREKYFYCFWCGTQYSDKADLDGNCPGEDEEAHD